MWSPLISSLCGVLGLISEGPWTLKVSERQVFSTPFTYPGMLALMFLVTGKESLPMPSSPLIITDGIYTHHHYWPSSVHCLSLCFHWGFPFNFCYSPLECVQAPLCSDFLQCEMFLPGGKWENQKTWKTCDAHRSSKNYFSHNILPQGYIISQEILGRGYSLSGDGCHQL